MSTDEPLSAETLRKHVEAWQERYLSLYRRLKLTCAYCGGNSAHEMGCVASTPSIQGLDAFDIELITPLAPLRERVEPQIIPKEER